VELANANYFILLALAEGPKHGLEIQRQVVGDSLGFYIRTSTLYTGLEGLARTNLIELATEHERGRRKTYRLTEQGKRRLEYAARVQKRAVELTQQRLGWR